MGRENKSTPKALKSPSLTDIAWAAGIFEGEGYARNDGGTAALTIVQKDDWLCPQLQALFGGSVSARAHANEWRVSGPRARGFLLTIFSFLSPRRRAQVRLAIQ